MTSKRRQLGLSAEYGHSGDCFRSNRGLTSFPEQPLQVRPQPRAPQCQPGWCQAS